jgi:hypothetical protein
LYCAFPFSKDSLVREFEAPSKKTLSLSLHLIRLTFEQLIVSEKKKMRERERVGVWGWRAKS